MAEYKVVNAGLTIGANQTIITDPLNFVASGSLAIPTGTVVVEAAVYADVGVDLTNASTIDLFGRLVQTGTGGRLGIEAAVDLYGTGNRFTNQGLIVANGLEVEPNSLPLATQDITFQSDGVFVNGGSVLNQAGATIEANGVGIYASNFGGVAAEIVNQGVILGTSFSGLLTIAANGTLPAHVEAYVTYGFGVQLGGFSETLGTAAATDSLINGGTIMGDAALVATGTGSIVNSGLIGGIADHNQAYVSFAGNPNASGVAIYGFFEALYGTNGSFVSQVASTLDIVNRGTIESDPNAGYAINLQYGSINNAVDGTIAGYAGAIRSNNTATLDNAGTLFGGINMVEGGIIRNEAGGTIYAERDSFGVYLNGGTLVNAGTVEGFGGSAVGFGGAGGTVVIEPGAVFGGNTMIAATVAADVVEFASGSLHGGTIDLSPSFAAGNALAFAPGTSVTVEGGIAQLAAGQTINGFSAGDTIVLEGFAATSDSFVSYLGSAGLVLSNGSGTTTIGITGNFTTADFVVSASQSATTIATAPCFAAGTRLLTDRGEIAIEALTVGDRLIRHDGAISPIIWIGRRRLDLRRHSRPETVQPIVIEPDAICDGVPARTLTVSPDHALFLDGHLIPAKALLNGVTIHQATQHSVTYFHVELAGHAVIYAHGCPVESYLDTGNRGDFVGPGVITLHPDFAQRSRETTGCAPFVEAGPVVETLRTRLLARAGIKTSHQAAMRLRTQPDGAVIIQSRAAIPGDISPDPRDRRRLGVKIAELRAGPHLIPLDHPALIEGWHAPEPDGRWTNGKAVIPAILAAKGPITIELAATQAYSLHRPPPSKPVARHRAPFGLACA